jgi:hypothetical protein
MSLTYVRSDKRIVYLIRTVQTTDVPIVGVVSRTGETRPCFLAAIQKYAIRTFPIQTYEKHYIFLKGRRDIHVKMAPSNNQ